MVNTLCVESETEPHLEMNLQYLDLKKRTCCDRKFNDVLRTNKHKIYVIL